MNPFAGFQMNYLPNFNLHMITHEDAELMAIFAASRVNPLGF